MGKSEQGGGKAGRSERRARERPAPPEGKKEDGRPRMNERSFVAGNLETMTWCERKGKSTAIGQSNTTAVRSPRRRPKKKRRA